MNDFKWFKRTLGPIFDGKSRHHFGWRFVIYSIYAWGIPLIIVLIGQILDFIKTESDDDEFIRPNFGFTKCWFMCMFVLYKNCIYRPLFHTSVCIYIYRQGSLPSLPIRSSRSADPVQPHLFLLDGNYIPSVEQWRRIRCWISKREAEVSILLSKLN